MKRLLIPILLLLGGTTIIHAQTTADALRFSQFGIGGSARTVGIGGSIGALGADFSVISTNPAGLGTYRGSEFTMTPSLFRSTVDASLVGGGTGAMNASNLNFNFNNIGVVFNKNIDRANSKWRTSNFGVGIVRIANFNEEFSYAGSTPGSYVDFFQDVSRSLFPQDFNDFDNGLAWDVGAIYDLEQDGFYETDFELSPGASIQKSQTIERTGSINEVVFGLGGIRGTKLQLGVTLGFPIVSYSERNVYMEDDNEADNVEVFKDLAYTQDLTTTGFGFNLKTGFIYRLTKTIRVGGAVHTPTRLRLTDEYQTSLVYDFDDGVESGPLEASSPEQPIEYDLRTPWRFIGSGAIVIPKRGFISAEVEYLNYAKAEFKEPRLADGTTVNTGIHDDVNTDIRSSFKSALLLRVGGEYVLDKIRLRAGVNLNSTPYSNEDINTLFYSAGIGYRTKKFFVDAAYRLRAGDRSFSPYSVGGFTPQVVNLNDNKNNLLLTLGFRF